MWRVLFLFACAALVAAAPITNGRVLGGKSIGHTSVVFKLHLEGGADAAYKPRTKRGPARYKGEIAAYRLACALELRNVPVAVPRAFAHTELLSALGGPSTPAGALFDAEAIADRDGSVPGALLPWIPKLEFLPLETDEWRARWTKWLSHDGALTETDRPLAAQVSTMIVFDWVAGNWDRWSGGNIGFARDTGTLLFIDNDAAFYEVAPPRLDAQLALLRTIDRFSRPFVNALRPLDASALSAIFGVERDAPLLSDKAIDGVASRIRTALALIDEKRAKWGDARVLAFERSVRSN